MTGKNVFVIGNGCSATQFVPQIAKQAKSVKQAVRSKHWYAKRPADISSSKVWRWCLRFVPGFWRVQRLIIFVVLELSMLMMFKNRLGTMYRNHFANACIKYAKATAPLKYHEAVIPKEGELQPGCKRRVFDTDYLTCLNRENVDLVTSHVAEIKENSVITKDGQEHAADVIVLANGFAVTEMGFPMRIEGKGGITIQEYWKKKGGPQSYRSCMMSEFPNFFLGMGTNSGTGHFSYIFTSECLSRFAIRVMTPVLEAPRPYIFDPKSPLVKRGPTFCVKADAEKEEIVWIQALSQKSECWWCRLRRMYSFPTLTIDDGLQWSTASIVVLGMWIPRVVEWQQSTQAFSAPFGYELLIQCTMTLFTRVVHLPMDSLLEPDNG